MKRGIAAVLLAGVMGLSSVGCMGTMALTGKVTQFNLSVTEGKWGREAVFLALYIIPVYGIAGLVDLLIVNSIEFHTGTNPITGDKALVLTQADGTEASATLLADGSVDIEVVTPEGETHRMNMIRAGDRTVARDENQQPLAWVDSEGVVTPVGGSPAR